MITARNGSHPPTPTWPDRLTHPAGKIQVLPHIVLHTLETPEVFHSYVADGWPMPGCLIYIGQDFYDWFPATTEDRAEHFASRIV